MIDELPLRQLQQESARALSAMAATNNNIHQFNKKAHHNSQAWYKAILEDYISKHGDLPSKKGPGTTVSLLLDE